MLTTHIHLAIVTYPTVNAPAVAEELQELRD